MLAQRFEFHRLALVVAVLEESLGFLLGQRLLIVELHELLLLSGESTLSVGQVAAVLGDAGADALKTCSGRRR